MRSLSPISTSSTDSGQHEELLEELVEYGFGYPLQRMVPLESMRLGGEESPLAAGLYRMPASQCSSTSSHMFYVYVVSFDNVPRPRSNVRLLATLRRSSTSIFPTTK